MSFYKDRTLQEGDIFYVERDGQYSLFKLLKYDTILETLHLTAFEPLTARPTIEQRSIFNRAIYHFPIATTGFDQPLFLMNEAVVEEDLVGYFEYIKQTQHGEELVKYAKQYYSEGYSYTTAKKYELAIEAYTKAIDFIPAFYEAIDNRAFCYMDLGNWEEAIAGFKQSLEVKPDTLLAVFSIGECLMKMEDYEQSKKYFERAIQINPSFAKSREFLDIVTALSL
jgi:tetratricopeptide (TPR) repeat protein